MNSSKRGAAYGFRLQSLDLVSKKEKNSEFSLFCEIVRLQTAFCASCLQLLDTKSTDRKQTLLHFIVSIIQEKYPELQSFYSELHFLDKAALGEHEWIVVRASRLAFFFFFLPHGTCHSSSLHQEGFLPSPSPDPLTPVL